MISHDTIAPVHEPSARSGAAYAKDVDASSVASGPSARRWRPAPGVLMSLWDMLRAYASHFIKLQNVLAQMAELFDRLKTVALETAEEYGLAHKLATDCKINIKDIWRLLIEICAQAETMCGHLALKMSLLRIQRIRSKCAGEPSAGDLRELLTSFKELNILVADELGESLFLFVAADHAAYWSETPLFSNKARSRCRKAADDMVEAGKCLAVGRYTACVFHLMRVVEIGAKRFATKNL